jgi:hypothetical protein
MKHQMVKKSSRKIPANIRNVQNRLSSGHVYANIECTSSDRS